MDRNGDCEFKVSVDIVNASVALLLLPVFDMLNVCGLGTPVRAARLDPGNATSRCGGRKLDRHDRFSGA
jgi:hypothetical protein